MVEVFDLLAQRKFSELSAKAGALNQSVHLRPSSTLILGSALFQESQRIARESQGGDAADQDRSREMGESAKKLFNEELGRNPDYLPLRIELARIDLARLKPGQDPPEDLIKGLRELAGNEMAAAPFRFQIFSILAAGLRMRFEATVAEMDKLDRSKVKPAPLFSLVAQERTVLRRAIQANPEAPETYLALAETYLGDDGIRGLSGDQGSRQDILEPNFGKAIDVLKSAPRPTPQILKWIAAIYQQGLKKPRAALPYHRELIPFDPEGALQSLIACLLETADPARNGDPKDVDGDAHSKARALLDDFEKKQLPAIRKAKPDWKPDFPAFEDNLLALIAQDELRYARPGSEDALKAELLGRLKGAYKWYRDAGKPPPIALANNLAWYLAERKETVEEARKIIEEARREAGNRFTEAVNDTYGWTLYQQARFEERPEEKSRLLAGAEEVYKKLLSDPSHPSPSFSYRYARVLFEKMDYRKAKEEVDRAVKSGQKFDEAADAKRLQEELSDLLK